MANIKITLNTPADQRWSGTLPIEVRDLKRSVLQTRGFSDGTFQVPPGRYLVSATLPNGQQAGENEIVEVQEDDDKEVVLALDTESLPSLLRQTVSWTDPIKEFAGPLTRLFTSQTSALVHDVSLGGWLGLGINTPPPRRTMIARSTFDVKYSDGPALLEIGGERECTYFAVPVDENGTTTVQWSVDAAERLPAARFDFNGPVTSFFDYVQGGFAPQAKILSRSVIQQAERHLDEKHRSPLRATLAAYVLLRANELDGLDLWTDSLLQHFPRLPDTLPIRMEYLARVGRHREAVELLLGLPRIGVSWFRSGIMYAASRVKHYDNMRGQADWGLEHEGPAQTLFAKIVPTLTGLAEKLDLSASTTVLRDLPRMP